MFRGSLMLIIIIVFILVITVIFFCKYNFGLRDRPWNEGRSRIAEE